MHPQIVRRFRSRPACEILGGCHHRITKFRRQPNSDHVTSKPFANPDSCVETLSNHVGQSVIDRQLQLDSGMAFDEPRQEWRNDEVGGQLRQVEPESAGRAILHRGGVADRLIEIGEHGCKSRLERYTGFRRTDAARGAIEQTHAKPRFQPANRPAEGGRRNTKPARCSAKTARLDDRHKSREFSELATPHHCYPQINTAYRL